MGSELLKINSTAVVFLRISVGGVPTDHRPAQFTSVKTSVWFCEQRYQELLALLKPELPPASEFKKLPSGDFTGSDFVVDWKVKAWIVGSVTVLRKSTPHHSNQNVPTRTCTRLKQPMLPWLYSAEDPIAAEKEFQVQETTRYEGVSFLPYVICVTVRRKSLLPITAEKGIIPITSFFGPSPLQTSVASSERAFAREAEQLSSATQAAQSLSPASLESVHSNRTAALPGHASRAVDPSSVGGSPVSVSVCESQAADQRGPAPPADYNMKRSDLKNILRRPSKPMSDKSCGAASSRALKGYGKRLGGVGLSQDQARDALRQTCAALSTSSSTSSTASAGPSPMSPTASLSSTGSQSLSQGLSQSMESPTTTSPLLSPTLPQPKKPLYWEKLYHPVDGEVEMRDERSGHSQLRATTTARRCWVCDDVLLVSSSNESDATDVCRTCATSSRPERRVSVSERSPSSSVVSPSPGLRRRSSNSSLLASPALKRSSSCVSPVRASASASSSLLSSPALKRSSSCVSPVRASASASSSLLSSPALKRSSSCAASPVQARASVSHFQFGPMRPRLKRSSSLVDSVSSGGESSSSPPAKLSRFSSPLVEESGMSQPDDLASDDSDARFRSKICYQSRRKSLDNVSARSSAGGLPFARTSRSSSASSVTVDREASGEGDVAASSASVLAAQMEPSDGRIAGGWAKCPAQPPAVRSNSHTASSATVSRNAKLGRVMIMEPCAHLDDSLMRPVSSDVMAMRSSVSIDVLTDSSESSCSLGFKTKSLGTHDTEIGSGPSGDMLRGTSPEMAVMPYSPPEAASDNEVCATSRSSAVSAAAAGSDSPCRRSSAASLGSPCATRSSCPVAGPSCDSDSDAPCSVNDSDGEVIFTPRRGQKRPVRRGLRRPNACVDSAEPSATSGGGFLNSHGRQNDEMSASELPSVVEDGSQDSPESQTDELVDVAGGSKHAEVKPSYGSDTYNRSGRSKPPAGASQEPPSLTQSKRVEITPSTRMRIRKRLQRPKQGGKTAADSHRVETAGSHTAASDVARTASSSGAGKASSQVVSLDVFDFGQDQPDATPDAGGYPGSSQASSTCARELEDQFCVLISDDSGEEENIDVVASLETVTRRQLQRYVVQFRPKLKAIFSGEQYNDRHEKYKEGGKAGKRLAQQHALVSSAQQEVVAKILMAMFCRGNLKFYDYTMLVLLPECLVMLVAKLCNCSEPVAREKLIA